MDIPDTYDPEADLQPQTNTLELEQLSRHSEYDRYQRNSVVRQNETSSDKYLSDLDSSKPTSKHRSEWQDKDACLHSESKDPSSKGDPCVKTRSKTKWHGPGGYIKLVDGNLHTPNGTTYFASKKGPNKWHGPGGYIYLVDGIIIGK